MVLNKISQNFKHLLFRKRTLLLLLVLVFNPLSAQYELTKHSINSGSGVFTGGRYQIKGTIGQSDASDPLSSQNFTINGGFWHQNDDLIFKNSFD